MSVDSKIHYDHDDTDSGDVFGFWIYILTDCILFATLFATYVVMHKNTFGGPGVKDFIHLPYVFLETICLLLSSFTYGLAILGVYRSRYKTVFAWLLITFLFGTAFVGMEINEFIDLFKKGYTWHNSGALSAFFTLVGTHGFHVVIGLIWMMLMIIQVFKYRVSQIMVRRLSYLGLFWHFLDIVWIFVFTVVYLMEAI